MRDLTVDKEFHRVLFLPGSCHPLPANNDLVVDLPMHASPQHEGDLATMIAIFLAIFLLQLPFSVLSYREFRDLLCLVTVCPLEALDPRLGQLKRQGRKWFKKLLP